MIEQICDFIHNYFIQSTVDGLYSVVDGVLQTDALKPRQFFILAGSTFCGGIHQYGGAPITYAGENVTETFSGTLAILAIPDALLKLADEIETWVEKNGAVMNSPYKSESFADYKYEKDTGTDGKNNSADWRFVFRGRLNRWRKL